VLDVTGGDTDLHLDIHLSNVGNQSHNVTLAGYSSRDSNWTHVRSIDNATLLYSGSHSEDYFYFRFSDGSAVKYIDCTVGKSCEGNVTFPRGWTVFYKSDGPNTMKFKYLLKSAVDIEI